MNEITSTDKHEEDKDYSSLILSFGEAVKDADFVHQLQHRIYYNLLGLTGRKPTFPGSQPVSFAKKHINALINKDYYVCEKSDGVRFLLYYSNPFGVPSAFLIDRNFECRKVVVGGDRVGGGINDNKGKGTNYELVKDENHLSSLALKGKQKGTIHTDTLLDGELIWHPKESKFIFLIFDGLLMHGESLLKLPLNLRLQKVQNEIFHTSESVHEYEPHTAPPPFLLKMKEMFKPYGIMQILETEIPKQAHGNDGLIFTPVEEPYGIGTSPNLLKWKPSHMNTVDFQLRIVGDGEDFKEKQKVQKEIVELMDTAQCTTSPHKIHNQQDIVKDAPTKQHMELWVMGQGNNLEFYQNIPYSPKLSSFHLQIIECKLVDDDSIRKDHTSNNSPNQNWTFTRLRADKKQPNYIGVVKKIMESINDGVSSQELIDAIPAIRRAWRQRCQSQAQNNNNDSNQHHDSNLQTRKKRKL